MSAMVDLRGQLTGFRELFYVVLAEKERINIFCLFTFREDVFYLTVIYMRKLGLPFLLIRSLNLF
jgi:hypothetical protein